MAASGKAQALKDAYIEGIAREAGEEVMAEAGAANLADLAGKLGMQVGGDQASTFLNLTTGQEAAINDGRSKHYVIDSRRNVAMDMDAPLSAYPLQESEIKGGFPKEGGVFGIGGTENRNVMAVRPSRYMSAGRARSILDDKLKYGKNARGNTQWSDPFPADGDPALESIYREVKKGNYPLVEYTQQYLDRTD